MPAARKEDQAEWARLHRRAQDPLHNLVDGEAAHAGVERGLQRADVAEHHGQQEDGHLRRSMQAPLSSTAR